MRMVESGIAAAHSTSDVMDLDEAAAADNVFSTSPLSPQWLVPAANPRR